MDTEAGVKGTIDGAVEYLGIEKVTNRLNGS